MSVTKKLLGRFDRYIGPALAVLGVALLVAETRRPLRQRVAPRPRRWVRNTAVAAVALPGMRLALLPALLGLARAAERHHIGLLPKLRLPAPLRLGAELLVLDYVSYTWHRLLHSPLLWHFHLVHHLDEDMDLTTGWRFHAGEMLASVPYRGLLPALAGVRPGTVLLYEALFEAETAFHHSNMRLPLALEQALAHVIITPRAHGIHHSQVRRETDSNYGVVLSLWDRLHQTLRLNVPQAAITIGVPGYPEVPAQSLGTLLRLPLAAPRPWAGPDGTVPTRQTQGSVTELAG
ncbi:sterol desaturase family protein [Hymenobacter sp. HMF4947]|uniref:Sterol desaturase family protein n=1 Tax=Hymenobacter ginkgonis TaxID=2682976 RepID=A0A7K1TBM5_9BACT|nr:sterol desaturase family protein [Hymenobacter ginkgonis]MVN75581.1 sterol desaturase family protein [Hymenobacter ginkgonis]